MPEKEKKVRRRQIGVLIVKEDDFWPKRLFGFLISSGYLHQVLRCFQEDIIIKETGCEFIMQLACVQVSVANV